MPPQPITVSTPGLRFGALEWGAPEGPLALLLHGYPDTAWTWRRVAPALAAEGYRVVAPFSRGYAPTGPAPDGAYQSGALVRDAIELHAALGGDGRALLVGHDWGAEASYGVGVHAPGTFARIVAMSVPPVPTMRRELRRPIAAARQLRNSWYILANQVPAVPEAVFERFVAHLWAAWSPGYDAGEDLALLAAALPDRAHRTAALDYYRHTTQPWRRHGYAAEQRALTAVPSEPMLYLHGERDGCMLAEVGARAGEDLAAGSTVAMVAGAGHFLQLERPDEVAEQILAFAPVAE